MVFFHNDKYICKKLPRAPCMCVIRTLTRNCRMILRELVICFKMLIRRANFSSTELVFSNMIVALRIVDVLDHQYESHPWNHRDVLDHRLLSEEV